VSIDLIDCVNEKICNTIQLGNYRGPFGVDMMIVMKSGERGENCLLHPCVEINLRRTMGHVALALTVQGNRGTMSVLYNKERDKYELTVHS
jgi:hypothetical protein